MQVSSLTVPTRIFEAIPWHFRKMRHVWHKIITSASVKRINCLGHVFISLNHHFIKLSWRCSIWHKGTNQKTNRLKKVSCFNGTWIKLGWPKPSGCKICKWAAQFTKKASSHIYDDMVCYISLILCCGR